MTTEMDRISSTTNTDTDIIFLLPKPIFVFLLYYYMALVVTVFDDASSTEMIKEDFPASLR